MSEFQFLIGSLEALPFNLTGIQKLVFQFLIGSLEALSESAISQWELSFNSS